MGSLYRSEEMSLCQLFLQSEAAYACVSELGELGLVQFRDLNPDVNAFQRKFVNEVRRCDEMERKLRFLEKEIKKDGIPMLDTGDNPDAPAPREMIDLEATFEKLENEMKEVNANAEALKRNYLELTELKHILRKTQSFFEEADHMYHHQAASDPGLAEENINLLGEDGLRAGGQQQALRLGGHVNLAHDPGESSTEGNVQQASQARRKGDVAAIDFVAGVILRERIPAFERMLWRACRGNVFLKQAEIETPLEDPVTGDQVNKSVFIIFFQGDQLKSRVKKICEGFRATLYPCPETPAERREMAIGVMTRIEDLTTVLQQTQDHRHRVLVAAAKNIKVWFIKVRKIKAIYHTLNMFNLDVTQKCLIGECWCPVTDLDKIQLALRRGTERSGSTVPSILNRMSTTQAPPTYNRTNKFTECFQSIVDAYGVATYREVNAAPFAIISFPFLFSLMFGDLGHGFIMALFALWMVIKEKALIAKKIDNEIWQMFFGGRYVILLMGIFSMYSGFLYNDIFSKSMNIFGSGFSVARYNESDVEGVKMIQLNPTTKDWSGFPYPYGIDPIWAISGNKITLLNSYKMKLSVTMGVMQMFFGVCLSLQNHRFFKRPLNTFFMFIPEIVFLTSIFVYLIVLIFYKWIAFGADQSSVAPSLLIHFINMFLFNYPDKPESVKVFYPGQRIVQTLLIILAVAVIPVMLLVKPLLLKRQHQGRLNRQPLPPPSAEVVHNGEVDSESAPTSDQDEEEIPLLNPGMTGGGGLSVNSGDINQHGDGEVVHHDDQPQQPQQPQEEFEFGEVIINQAIHTIEYCLGCVSHTASYLRLWALSLAHAELSEVLWSMVFRNGLAINGYVGCVVIFLVFAPWAVLTIGVLLLMEGLSAFLHTLRLHWVEFQSKFYKGEGYIFAPFSFDTIIDEKTAEE